MFVQIEMDTKLDSYKIHYNKSLMFVQIEMDTKPQVFPYHQ